ncbi:hypothetical protein HGRIS_004417 [Hohenbuehelia grisea]|uniref:Mannosyltransferase n=1 Tax=Hohenbuehelia grisea TaxID=104357 RepID=A0ABR3JBX5_9AGAR
MSNTGVLQDLVLVAIGWVHVLLAPYTKVEESFNLHATHDILMYGFEGLPNYDHFTFPGAVQRTFIGSILLAFAAKPFVAVADAAGLIHSKLDTQIIIRLVLATANATGLILIRRSTSARFGRQAGLFFTLLTMTQFHVPFWMGRTLPNMFALLPVNIATSLLLKPTSAQYKRKNASLIAVSLIIFAAVVFRAELALFLAPILVHYVAETMSESPNFTRRLRRIQSLVKGGTLVGMASIVATITIDSYFWHHPSPPLWPELASIWFNVWQGKSADWGVSPYHTYITSALPKLLLTAFPLALLSPFTPLLLPAITFVLLMSLLGHKEWRFIVYIVPIFDVAAARTLVKMNHFLNRSIPRLGVAYGSQKSFLGVLTATFFRTALLLSPFMLLVFNAIPSALTTGASVLNYPGGAAMDLLHARLAAASTLRPQDTVTANVHICNLAAQTGASLFTQTFSPPYLSPTWANAHNIHAVYNKTEGMSPFAITTVDPSYSHLIIEMPPDMFFGAGKWKVVGTVQAFDIWKRMPLRVILDEGISQLAKDIFTKPNRFFGMELRDCLWILEREEWADDFSLKGVPDVPSEPPASETEHRFEEL